MFAANTHRRHTESEGTDLTRGQWAAPFREQHVADGPAPLFRVCATCAAGWLEG